MTSASPTVSKLSLAGIFGGLFFGYMGLMAVIPVLPGFVRDRYHASNLVVGVAVTATAVAALVIRPFAGTLADRRGYRLVMLSGAAILTVGALFYFLPIGLPGLVLVRLALGIGEAALFVGGAAWTVSLAPQNRRGQVIGLYGMFMWGGISLGTFAGAGLSDVGYRAVWTFSLVAPLVGAAFIALAPVRAARPDTPKAAPVRRVGLVPRPTVLPGIALTFGAAGYAGLASFVVLHLQARGIHSGVFVLSCFSAVYAGTRLFIGRLPDQLGPRRVATASGIGEAIGLVIVAIAPDVATAVIGAVVMGVGFSLLHPSLALMVMNRTDAAQQGAALGAYTSFWDLGLAVWGPLTGVVATGLGYPAVFVVGAICAGAAAAMAFVIGASRDSKPTPRPAHEADPATAATG